MKYFIKRPTEFSGRKIKIQMKLGLLLLFFPFHLFAQKNAPLPKDLSGVWTGYMYNDTTRVNNDFEMAVSENNGKLSGYTYTVFLIDGKKNIGVKTVKIKERKDLLIVEDDKLINDNYDAPPAKGVRTFIELHYSESDTSEILSGTWKTNITRQFNSVTGSLFLERKKKPEATAIIPKLRELNLSDQLSFLPKTIGTQQKNTDIAAKKPEDSKQTSTFQKTSPEMESRNTAGLIKKEDQKLDAEKIIPDTTITNPEITIFMFPKNDAPVKDTSKVAIKKDIVANEKDNPSSNLDSLLVLAAKKDQAIKDQKKNLSEKIQKTPEQKTKPQMGTVKNNVPSVVEKTTIPLEKLKDAPAQKSNSGIDTANSKESSAMEKAIATDSKIIAKNNDLAIENPSFPKKILTEIKKENQGDLELVKKELADKELKTILSQKLKDALEQKSNPVTDTAKRKELSVPEKATEKDSKIIAKKNNLAIDNSSFNKKATEINREEKGSQEEVKQQMAGKISNKTSINPNGLPAQKVAAENLSERHIETIRTVEVIRDTLIFSLFDNGVIDGDTVSVLLNGKVIMSRIGLLAKAYNDTIYLTPEMGDSINIILYAENLGSIPPNTGLLVVRDGGIDHEIRFSGDLKKNSAIILKRKRLLNER